MNLFKIGWETVRLKPSYYQTDRRDYRFAYQGTNGTPQELVITDALSQADANNQARTKFAGLVKEGIALDGTIGNALG
ncbi:MAG: hypothetical protein AAB445_04760 [Patescibacteria group bacterium]|mgnify:CR=1 FL=1